jgi:hypothetical protein
MPWGGRLAPSVVGLLPGGNVDDVFGELGGVPRAL